MKLKSLFTTILIAFSLVFSLIAYNCSAAPKPHLHNNTRAYAINNWENSDVSESTDIEFDLLQLLETQKEIEKNLVELRRETKELMQVLAGRDQIAFSSRKICRDSNRCP